MADANAWLLPVDLKARGRGRNAPAGLAACGEGELFHLVQGPKLTFMPGAVPWCCHVMPWQGLLLPALDLGAWQERRRSPSDHSVAAIAAFQPAPGEPPSYAALLLTDLPRRASVSDDQACATPPEWRAVALAAFELESQPIPILDLYALFSGGLSEVRAA